MLELEEVLNYKPTQLTLDILSSWSGDMHKLAEEAGVSNSTITKILVGKPIHPKTEKKIRKALEKISESK